MPAPATPPISRSGDENEPSGDREGEDRRSAAFDADRLADEVDDRHPGWARHRESHGGAGNGDPDSDPSAARRARHRLSGLEHREHDVARPVARGVGVRDPHLLETVPHS